ncbi:hypothetical protein SAMN02745216_02669 [Desulfatibacillum alkenivorans DSM 16219]|uniref:MotA/TolQ/ExbB proton channel family protein n=1 Tax=Desulfatibacillum alkenivorans DSM 16219 TaxID=1121393 RepID=A0A1M6NVD6_9BACT|nr:anti-phage ZorAB system protein ZorA [Desulfatibacillum alkenivorans]SHJ99666.1 hypothetical protein SAMN02745216_02669 [Desulfatibacillum alkenivorans DSM 16219]
MNFFSFLIPNFHDILNPDVLFTTRMSAGLIFILWAFLVIVAAYLVVTALFPLKSIKSMKKLLSELTPELLVEKRRDILLGAEEIPRLKRIWRLWDGTLVEGNDGKNLYATVNASQFFYSRAIAPEIVDNRFLAAVPGLLTAVGVLGTFLGLSIGLGGLDLSDKGMEHISSGVNHLITGASLAFSTSVWGVICSIAFNLIEKLTERRVRDRVRSLQRQINDLFPSLNPEDTLLLIEQHGRQSRETLQGLAEQIGDRMQESVNLMGVQMQQTMESLSKSMVDGVTDMLTPALEKLIGKADEFAGRQENGAHEALAELVEKFSNTLGKRAKEQGKAMENANREMQGQFSSFGAYFEKLSDSLDQKHQQALAQDESRTQMFQTIVKELQSQHSQLSDNVRSGVEANRESVVEIQKQAAELLTAVEKSQSALRKTTDDLGETVQGFGSATDNVKELVSTLRDASEQMASSMKDAGLATSAASSESAQVTANLDKLLAIVTDTQQQIEITRQGIQQASEAMVGGLSSSNQEMLEKLQSFSERFEQLSEVMDKKYSEAVSQDESRSTIFELFVEEMREQQKLLSENVRAGVEANNTSTSKVQAQQEELAGVVNQSQQSMQQAASELERVIGGFGDATKNINELVSTLKSASDQMAAALTEAGQNTATASKESARVSENLHRSLVMVRETQEQIETTRQGIKEASESVVDGMKSSIVQNRQLQDELKQHVEGLQKQVKTLLSEYSDQVNSQTVERLEEWNRQTRSFCSAMVNVVGQMNSVLAEMEDRAAK